VIIPQLVLLEEMLVFVSVNLLDVARVALRQLVFVPDRPILNVALNQLAPLRLELDHACQLAAALELAENLLLDIARVLPTCNVA
jgi:hypothetical protein